MGEEAKTNRDEEELTTKGEEFGDTKVDSAQIRTQDTSKGKYLFMDEYTRGDNDTHDDVWTCAVNILLRNVGDAPVLQHKEVLIRREEPLAKVIGFIQKQLGKAAGKEPGQPSVVRIFMKQ
jgi:hypothetical protein